jgi:putative oxidoreductase
MIEFINSIDRLIAKAGDPLAFFGRILIATFFLYAGIYKIQNYGTTATLMSTNDVPTWFLPLVIVLEVGGTITVVLGFLTRLTAVGWVAFTFIAGAIFDLSILDTHNAANWDRFWEDMTIAGGLLALAAMGPGRWSIDAWLADKSKHNSKPSSAAAGA